MTFVLKKRGNTLNATATERLIDKERERDGQTVKALFYSRAVH